jgi:hypothetical protein
MVNPFLSISIVDQLAQPSQLPNHRLLRHPPRWGMISCIVAKFTQLHRFGTNYITFGSNIQRSSLTCQTNRRHNHHESLVVPDFRFRVNLIPAIVHLDGWQPEIFRNGRLSHFVLISRWISRELSGITMVDIRSPQIQ